MSISEKAIAARGVQPEEPKAKAPKICPECHQKIPHPRNADRHKLLFAILKPAFSMWPETADFQPTDTEDLRAYLLIKVGWKTVEEVKIAGGSKKQILAGMTAFMNRKREKPVKVFEQTDDGVKGYAPKSIAWHRCKESEFKTILEAVIAEIENTIGVPIEQLKREHENEC